MLAQPRRPCGPQVPRLFLSPHAAVLTPGSRSLPIPIASRSTLAFTQNVGARRVVRLRRIYPCAPDSPSNTRRGLRLTELQRSFGLLRPANLVGVTDWVSPVPARCRPKQFRTAVSGQVPPTCYQADAPSTYSAKWDLAEPDSFHSGRNKLQTSYTSAVTGHERKTLNSVAA